MLFRESTVLENVLVASHLGTERGFARTLLGTRRYRTLERDAHTRAERLLATLRLRDAAGRPAGSLPHRDQKALSLAMVLATGADLVILDEPLAGLTTQESEDTMAALRALRAEGKTILLVEHDMRAVMGLCDVITVLDHGVRIARGHAGPDPGRSRGHRGVPRRRGHTCSRSLISRSATATWPR